MILVIDGLQVRPWDVRQVLERVCEECSSPGDCWELSEGWAAVRRRTEKTAGRPVEEKGWTEVRLREVSPFFRLLYVNDSRGLNKPALAG